VRVEQRELMLEVTLTSPDLRIECRALTVLEHSITLLMFNTIDQRRVVR
jgi:hypothetical protein